MDRRLATPGELPRPAMHAIEPAAAVHVAVVPRPESQGCVHQHDGQRRRGRWRVVEGAGQAREKTKERQATEEEPAKKARRRLGTVNVPRDCRGSRQRHPR